MSTEEKKVEEYHSGMELMLHPLVVISVSDHFTRARLSSPPNRPINAVGILLGMIKNGKVEVTNSFDVIAEFDSATGKLTGFDTSFLQDRTKAFLDVFPGTTVVGWYQVGNCSDEDALIVSRALLKSEMLAMSFDAIAAYDPETKDIPIQLFEVSIKGKIPSERTASFKKTSYHIITVEAERIGVDHIAKTSTTEGSSQLTVHVLGMQGAMKMLKSKIEVICDYLQKVKNGERTFDCDIMRKIGVLYDLLLTNQAPDFDQRFFVEYNDEMLLTYLSSLTEGLQTMNTMVDAHVVNAKHIQRHPASKKTKHVGHF